MDSPPTVDEVFKQICMLYYYSDSAEREKADKWLIKYKNSIYSWSISEELLQQKRDENSCFFAAQTIRNKVQSSLMQLPSNSHKTLRDSLIMHITREENQLVLTQLTVAVADLVLVMNEWENPVTDLLQMLAERSTLSLLGILARIPEEIQSKNLRLGKNRKQEVHKQFMASTPKLLEFLFGCFSTVDESNEKLYNGVMACYNSWLDIDVIPPHIFIENPITEHIFHILLEPDSKLFHHDTSTDCLCSFLSCLEAASIANKLDSTLSAKIYNKIYSLKTSYRTTITKNQRYKMMNYCRIFTVMAEAYLSRMVSCAEIPHYTIGALDLLLMCDDYSDYEVCEITLNFWYSLGEELLRQNNNKLTMQFKPYVDRLMVVLYKHAQIDYCTDGLINRNDDFGYFRSKVADLIRDMMFIVGSNRCFNKMYEILTDTDSIWIETESALFVMQIAAKNLVYDENDTVQKVIEAILNMPEHCHIALRHTSITLLGELSSWIDNHSDILETILNFLNYFIQQNTDLVPAAITALTLICATSKQKMIKYLNELMVIAKYLDILNVSTELAIDLLKSFALVVSCLPRQHLEIALREIVSFQLQPLALLVEDPNATPESIPQNKRSDPIYWIDCVCVIIQYTVSNIFPIEVHPSKQLLIELWPLLSSILNKYQSNVRIMERTCRLLKYSIRILHKQVAPLVEPLVKHMVNLYSIQHHSCFLYLASVLVSEFANIKEYTSGLLEMVQAFIDPTVFMLREENGLENNSDIVDDFFRLCSRFIDSSPVSFLQSKFVTYVFQCAIHSCIIDHREANFSVMNFLGNLLKYGRTTKFELTECRPIVKDIAEQNGESLVVNLLNASVFHLDKYMLPDVAEVFYELKIVLTEKVLKEFLIKALNMLPKVSCYGLITARQEQLDDFVNTVLTGNSAKAISDALREFALLYR
ncbi:transportin-3-like [Teleopsis dalmanni]|uniref:transportin-3-like n=1 Tax=Teleopsis dalmanni TaxID=139649 RepID=UPI0018CE55BF|nr:transportin-3-like [Teleopsis dalmanni]